MSTEELQRLEAHVASKNSSLYVFSFGVWSLLLRWKPEPQTPAGDLVMDLTEASFESAMARVDYEEPAAHVTGPLFGLTLDRELLQEMAATEYRR